MNLFNFLTFFLGFLFLPNDNLKQNEDKKMSDFLKKDEVTILVTDSGLGGLSVFSEIDKIFQNQFPFKKVKLVFYNSCPESDIGYNKMRTRKEQLNTFDNALQGMMKWYNPDIILIACNTLSVIYDETNFSKSSKIPVIGIVDFGVDMIFEQLKNKKDNAIIFATRTTIEAGTHIKKLIEKGISEDRIIGQPCLNLAGEIEKNSKSDKVKELVKFNVEEALQKMKNKNDHLFIGLCCTHYGYSSEIFKEVFEKEKNIKVDILDPNSRMSNYIFRNEFKNRFKKTNVSLEVVSRAKIFPNEIKSIGSLIVKSSKRAEKALEKYNYKKNLFEYIRPDYLK